MKNNEIKIGEKYYIEVEVTKHINTDIINVKPDLGIEFIVNTNDLIQHSQLMQVPEIGKEYDFSIEGKWWYKEEFKGYRAYNTYNFIRPIQHQPSELELLQQQAEKLGYKLVKE